MEKAKLVKVSIYAIGLCLMALLFTSCIVYSVQDYGVARVGTMTVATGDSKAELLKKMGIPSAIYSDKDSEVFVYCYGHGMTVLSVYTVAERRDVIIELDGDGTVTNVNQVDWGKGITILGPPMTLPLPECWLRYGPYALGNYLQETGIEK